MVRILVSPDQLIEVSGRFLTQRQELERMCDRLDKQIYFIREGWSGATRERFFQEYLVARQSMGVTMEQISSIAQQLNFIARSFAEADGEGGSAIVMPSLPPEVEAKLKSGVDFTASAINGLGATIEGLFDDAVGTGKSLWENPFGTTYNMAYAFTVGRVVDASIGLRFAWDYAWGTGTAQADAERFVEQMKQDVEEKGTGYYAGYVTSQAAAYLTIGKVLKKSHAKHDDLGGSGTERRTDAKDKNSWNLDDLKNINDFKQGTNSNAINHIFEGEVIKGNAVGFHYEGVLNSKGKVSGNIDPPNEYGVYRANIEVDGVPKQSKSTFFPKDWTPQQVIDEINVAFTNKVVFKNNRYRGVTSTGMTIEMIMKNGKVVSAYPIY